jgi:protein arginine kinase
VPGNGDASFFTELLQTHGEWLRGTGPESDVVVSTRIRLARNVEGHPFVVRLTPKALAALAEHLRTKIREAFAEELRYVSLREATGLDRLFLHERHLISRDHLNGHGDRGVAFEKAERVSIMTLEEDHLRIQVLGSGFEPERLWSETNAVDDRLEAKLDYAFHPEFGYLTACPTNAGTGMRVSVMLHLPSLALTKQIEKVFRAASQLNLIVRGFYGEGTQARGDFFQISNQVTLGKSETEIVEEIRRIIPKMVEFERNVRRQLLEKDRGAVEERVRSAHSKLRAARAISSEEAMSLLSAVRLGVSLDLIRGIPLSSVNELFILTQPAHLQKLEGRALKTAERDERRAVFLRERLEAVPEV